MTVANWKWNCKRIINGFGRGTLERDAEEKGENLNTTVWWEIHVAVNDPDNGMFRGSIEAIQLMARGVLDIALKLDNQFIPPATIAFRRDGDRVRIGRKWFHIQNYREWVGNWCWDMMITDAETAAAILNYVCNLTLHGQKKFSPETGWTSMWELYETGTFSADALSDALASAATLSK